MAKKRLTEGEQMIVNSVREYFIKERDNKGPLLPLTSIRQRTAEACNVSEYQVGKVTQEFRNPSRSGTTSTSKLEKKKRISPKSKDANHSKLLLITSKRCANDSPKLSGTMGSNDTIGSMSPQANVNLSSSSRTTVDETRQGDQKSSLLQKLLLEKKNSSVQSSAVKFQKEKYCAV